MNWNTNLYDQKHDFVSKYGEEVVKLLDPKTGEDILDLGCGTGDLAEMISASGANIRGIDSSPEMIETARKKYPHIVFEVKSADDFSFERKFDAVFSNAALHWVLDKEKAIGCIFNSLKTGGRFVAEFGGKGNVANILNALKNALNKRGLTESAGKNIWYFPSLSEYSSLLETSGFRVVFATHFDRKTLLSDNKGIRNWVRMFGEPYLQGLKNNLAEEVLEDVEKQVAPTNYKNDNWYADYVRLRVAAVKV